MKFSRDAPRDEQRCPQGARNFLAIVAQGRAQTGRARIGIINRAVNLAIEPMSDMAQWGVPDRWSPPLETFTTGRGDCEDYAIAKYVALTAAGVPAQDVKLIIVRNTAANEDHAVVAVRDGGDWIILDNRWLTLVKDVAMPKIIPEFVLDDAGVREFVPPTIAVAQRAAGARFGRLLESAISTRLRRRRPNPGRAARRGRWRCAPRTYRRDRPRRNRRWPCGSARSDRALRPIVACERRPAFAH